MGSKTIATLAAAAATALAAADASATTSCSFTMMTGAAFGTYDVFTTTPLDTAGSLSFVCTGVGSMDTIVVDLSRGGASTYSPRQMSSGSATLSYNLYLDAARTVVWGDGASGTSQYGPMTPTSGSTVTVPIYARIPALQNAYVGSYGDTIVATIVF
jgi:spore coat protein U-like protein